MTTKASVADAKKRLSELLGRVQYAGEHVVITKRGKPVAVLVPVSDAPAEDLAEGTDWLREVHGMLAGAPEACDAIDKAYASRSDQLPRPVPDLEPDRTRRAGREREKAAGGGGEQA